MALFLYFRPFSACKSKNFLYFCNQVLADRRDTTLLRQTDLSPREGAGMILVVNSKAFAIISRSAKSLGNLLEIKRNEIIRGEVFRYGTPDS